MTSYLRLITISCLDFLSYCEKVDNGDLFMMLDDAHENKAEQIISDFIKQVPYHSLDENTLQQRYNFISELITSNFSLYFENDCVEQYTNPAVWRILAYRTPITLFDMPQQHSKRFLENAVNNTAKLLSSTAGKLCVFAYTLSSCIISAKE